MPCAQERPHTIEGERLVLPEECPILVVDDDPDIREIVTEVLSLEGYPVHAATNGAEGLQAIEVLRAKDPECRPLVLLDMRMPILDGWGVARKMKKRGLQVPIVVMTAARDARAWAAEIGADGCLPKPFELADLLTTVQRLRPV